MLTIEHLVLVLVLVLDRKDGIEIYRDGKIYADELDISEITMAKQLVTKEYVDANSTDDQTSAEVTRQQPLV